MALYTVLRVTSSHLLRLRTVLADIGWVTADGMRSRQEDQKFRVILACMVYSRIASKEGNEGKEKKEGNVKKTAKLSSDQFSNKVVEL